MHLDEHLVILWNRFLDLLELKEIGWTVSRTHDCLHELPPHPPAGATEANMTKPRLSARVGGKRRPNAPNSHHMDAGTATGATECGKSRGRHAYRSVHMDRD